MISLEKVIAIFVGVVLTSSSSNVDKLQDGRATSLANVGQVALHLSHPFFGGISSG